MKAGKKQFKKSDSKPSNQVFVGIGKRNLLHRTIDFLKSYKMPLVFLVVLLLVGLSLFAVVGKYNHDKQTQKLQKAKAVALIKSDAKQSIDSQNMEKLEPTIEKIKNQPGYDKDIDYLYALTEYYIGISDPINARKFFDMYSNVYKQQNTSPTDAKTMESPDTLRPVIEFLEKQSQAIRNQGVN